MSQTDFSQFFNIFKKHLSLSLSLSLFLCRYMAEILLIRRKTPYNLSLSLALSLSLSLSLTLSVAVVVVSAMMSLSISPNPWPFCPEVYLPVAFYSARTPSETTQCFQSGEQQESEINNTAFLSNTMPRSLLHVTCFLIHSNLYATKDNKQKFDTFYKTCLCTYFEIGQLI